jgi:hypothetical protein
MGKLKALWMIEQQFVDTIEALSSKECQFNYRLLGKTKKVATLLRKLAQTENLVDVDQSHIEEVREEKDREQA